MLNAKAVDEVLPIQDAEAVQTILQIVREPHNWYDQIRRYPIAVILASVFGLRGMTFDSPRVKALYDVQDQLIQITEIGAIPPIDMFPWLKNLPDCLSSWRRWAYSIRKQHRNLWFGLMKESRDHMRGHKDLDCFLKTMLENKEKTGLDDEHIAYLAGTCVCSIHLSSPSILF